eukprot:6207109-Pleurochrysis_carterae.AAC.1
MRDWEPPRPTGRSMSCQSLHEARRGGDAPVFARSHRCLRALFGGCCAAFQVIGGTQHLGETGMVVRVGAEEGEGAKARGGSDPVLYIFSDLTANEFQVRASFVQKCKEVSAGLERLGAFELYDLVRHADTRTASDAVGAACRCRLPLSLS